MEIFNCDAGYEHAVRILACVTASRLLRLRNEPMKRLTAVIFLAAALPSFAQTQQKPADQPPLVERLEVRVINIDVVVTDKKGNRIHGLTKDDFDIYENGVPKN